MGQRRFSFRGAKGFQEVGSRGMAIRMVVETIPW